MTTITTKYPFSGSIATKQGGRAENQDNAGFVDTPLGLLVVVCDGMGGGPGGRTASLMAVETILNVLSDVSEHTHREDALRFAIEKANDIIYTKATETPELRGMGTTVAAILINETSAIIAHVGDTRVYQLRKGAIAFRSSDHSVVANLVRLKRITEEEARNHPQSNIVTRALGIRPSMEIEFDEVSFHRSDRFVICTDGIWGMMPQPDLVKSLSRVMGIDELTGLMAEEIDKMGQEKGGGHDNLTLAILDTSFDSVLKNNKKKCLVRNGNKPSNCCFQGHNKKCIIWILVIFLILSSLTICLYKILPLKEADTKQEQDDKRPKEVIPPKANVKPQIVNEDNTAVPKTESEPISPSKNTNKQDRVIVDPFQDTLIIQNRNNETMHLISVVVSDLDKLKEIRGKNRKGATKKKKNFVEGTIKPKVNKLGNQVAVSKKKNVKQIINMLNDNRTVQSSEKGDPTKEGNAHIESIKKIVTQLKD